VVAPSQLLVGKFIYQRELSGTDISQLPVNTSFALKLVCKYCSTHSDISCHLLTLLEANDGTMLWDKLRGVMTTLASMT
jgi:hypothetical protein